MPSTITDLISKEQIRTFHVSGRGLDFAEPAGPLRPAVLDQLEQLPAFETADVKSVYESSLKEARSAPRARFAETLRQARAGLQNLLILDDQRKQENASGEAISAALGNEANAFFNTGALAAALETPRRGLRRMETAQRQRIEDTINTLAEALREIEQQPTYVPF